MVETLIRKAVLTDAQDILDLVNGLAQDQVMLPRSPASVVEHIRDFQVAQVDGAFAGCSALAVIWSDIAEVRSIAVSPEHQGLGLGHRMLERLIGEALQLGVQRVMAFTYIPDFFVRRGFHLVQHTDLPHKVFNDCLNCPKFHCCDEVAVLRELYSSNSSPRREPASLPTPGVPLPRIANPTSERVA
ncbi:MAG: N-acetyltransferase, partial [Planctomycetota bacterium]